VTARSFRFGAADGHRFSDYWKISATAKRPELVIIHSRTGKFFHVTMHEDPDHWHVKVTIDGVTTEHPWTPPSEIIPGARRLIRLFVPLEAVRYAKPARAARVNWYTVSSSADDWTYFSVLLCAGVMPRIKNGEEVGRVSLADSSTAVVVAGIGGAQPGSAQFRVEDKAGAIAKLRDPNNALLLQGVDSDGSLWFLHLYNASRDG
jgi:hypothetical protein